MTPHPHRRRVRGRFCPCRCLFGSSSSSSSAVVGDRRAATAAVTTTTAATAATAALSGSLKVFAAASLTGAFNAPRPRYGAHPGLSLTYDFAGSNALVTQIEQGAPADVFASADQANMQKLVTAGDSSRPR